MKESVPAASAWRAWIRLGSRLTPPAQGCLELGRGIFWLPEPKDAPTTTWVCRNGQFSIFTGYLYGAPALVQQLVRELNPRQSSPSPAEIVLAGYRKWGCEVLEKLIGRFATLVWDQQGEFLLCGRDAVGLHPFFYSAVGGDLVLSWDIETIRHHPMVGSDFNRPALAEHLMHRWWNAQETYFADIQRLPGGYGLKSVAGRTGLFRYWNPLPGCGPAAWVTPDEMDRFPSLFRVAVEDTMQCGGGRAGIFLSGGIDSVSVAVEAAAVASERGWAPPEALSVIFPDEICEEPIQRAVAEALSLPQNFSPLEKYLRDPGLLRGALEFAASSPSPPTFAFAPAFLDLLVLARSRQCQVVLTGDGGDETLGVSPIYAADLLASGRWLDVAHMVQMLARYWDGPLWRAVRSTVWTWGLRALLRDWVWRKAPRLALWRRRQLLSDAMPSWLAPDQGLRRELISRFEERWNRQTSNGSLYVSFLADSLSHPLPQMAFEEQFYRNATTGIPTLHPYWHREVVEFLLRTPPEILNGGNRWKSVVRTSLAKRLPGLGFDRQKKLVPTAFPKKLLRMEGPGLWRDLGGAQALAALGLVEADAYHAMLARNAQSGRGIDLCHLWHGAGTEAWLRSHAR